MQTYLSTLSAIFLFTLFLASCSDSIADKSVAEYEALLSDWDAGFACIGEKQMQIDRAYDEWDEVYQVLPEVYPSLPGAASKTFIEVEEEVKACRKYYYQMLAELRIVESLKGQYAPYTKKLRQAVADGVQVELPDSVYASIQQWIDPMKETCKKYAQPLENSPDCQVLMDAYKKLRK